MSLDILSDTFKNINPANLTSLGKVCLLLADKEQHNFINIEKIQEKIIELLNNGEFLFSKTEISAANNNIFNLIAESNYFDFLKNNTIKEIVNKNKKSIIKIINYNDDFVIKNDMLISNNIIVNLLNKNKFDILDILAPIINLENLTKEHYLNIIKSSLTYGYTKFIENTTKIEKELIQSYRTPYSNISFFCKDLKTLKSLEDYVGVKVSSLDEWYQNRAFLISKLTKKYTNYFKNKNLVNHIEKDIEEFYNLTLECKSNGVNIELVPKSNNVPPPLWLIIFNEKNIGLKLYEKGVLNPSVVDGQNRNLPCFLFELNKKYAPYKTDAYIKLLELIIKDQKYDLKLKNNFSYNSLDYLKKTLEKKTLKNSEKLNSYKIDVERMLLLAEFNNQEKLKSKKINKI